MRQTMRFRGDIYNDMRTDKYRVSIGSREKKTDKDHMILS